MKTLIIGIVAICIGVTGIIFSTKRNNAEFRQHISAIALVSVEYGWKEARAGTSLEEVRANMRKMISDTMK